ncbi:anti-sigma regulatory factor (Ser/Thr protein kinase) [Luteibacter sp. 1214]|uniref:ATP-binding protein n=1 Tax=Luteibacter sp. 1214 TaxID=2817735 RepID=UPI00285DB5A9|nr:ATP-binding protein [Luteibacter sp. 1214]MDR6642883.1 anti-sigma regulatory factor (Ser/Thr protein kinase) [Luteibacter sp. 1214]
MDLTFDGGLTDVVPVEETSQIGQARRVAQQIATQAGFDATDAGRVALIATELATNVLKHARGGEIHVATVPGIDTLGVEIIAVDRGPGFNLADCLPDGFSTGGTRGEGLGAVKRQADIMDMYADARGSVVLARMYPKGFTRADIRFGASHHALHSEPVSGDGWGMALNADAAEIVMVDGLGHGVAAHEAARACIDAWRATPFEEPVSLMVLLDTAMHGGRGGAVAVARFDRRSESLRYTGIGNISAGLHTLDGSRGLASHPGIVGVQARRAQAFDFPDVGGRLLIMHSDGLQSRWSLKDYPGLGTRHPAVIAALLHRDFCRGRDDATVFAIRLEATA